MGGCEYSTEDESRIILFRAIIFSTIKAGSVSALPPTTHRRGNGHWGSLGGFVLEGLKDADRSRKKQFLQAWIQEASMEQVDGRLILDVRVYEGGVSEMLGSYID